MDRRTIHNLIIPSEGYAEIMESVVLPYLAERKTEKYCEREQGKRSSICAALQTSLRALSSCPTVIRKQPTSIWKISIIFFAGDTMSSCRNTADTAAATGCAVIPGISLWYILMIIKDM